MKTNLYYFSGTGNALSVAKGIKERLEDCELNPIPRIVAGENGKTLEIKSGAIGIVCPIYMYNMPHIVSRFIEKILNADYLFMVYAGGGELGGRA